MKKLGILVCFAVMLLLAGGLLRFTDADAAGNLEKTVVIDGNSANTKPQSVYRGLGMVSGNNSSRLLLDYKAEHPDTYWKIMEYMFDTEKGMGLSHLKIEMGSDVNSSSGTEPSLKRYRDEAVDVTRGAGFQLAADAKTINPELTLDMLYWSEPLWVSEAEDKNAARYQWYKEILDAAYETYGLKFDFVSANRNEKTIYKDWLVYFSDALKAETDTPYDYSKIKIVAADETANWRIAGMMLEEEALRNAIDVIGSHYTSWSNDKVRELNKDYGKEVWFSEGSSPMSYTQETYRYDGTGSGMSDINGMLDIATRIITMYPGGGMTLYEFQPVVAAYYDGVTYYPKQLISANEPWTGYYTLDPGFYMALHFSQFAKTGWQLVDGACEGDGKAGGDGHAIIDSTYNYMTVMDPATGDYSVVIANNSDNTITYNFEVSNLAMKNAPLELWETRGPDDDSNYYQNFYQKTQTITPEDKGNGTSSFQVVVAPYSLVTASTLKGDGLSITSPNPVDSTILALPYEDDFEYAGYEADYLLKRGYAPRYTTDEGGAFEIVDLNGNKVIQQKVTYDIKARDWGRTPNPVTNLGDDNWTNYSVSIDTLFSEAPTGKEKINYVGVGARYILADSGNSGYWLQLFEDGTYQLNRQSEAVATGKLESFDKTAWTNLKIAVNQNQITCFINNDKVIEYADQGAIIASGRVGLYSEFNTNYFDNLKVEPLEGSTPYSVRLNELDSHITFSGAWTHNTMSSFRYFKRTISTGSEGASLTFDYTGEGFAIIGEVTEAATLKVEIDGTVVEDGYLAPVTGFREALYYNYSLPEGEHAITITVLSGSCSMDAVEMIRSSNQKMFELAAAESEEPEVTQEPEATQAPAANDNETGKDENQDTSQAVEDSDNNSSMLLWIVGGIAVIAIGGAILFLMKKKKS